ncbi:hypothetical protein GCM10009646_88940 [Streptomyces aureus]
MPLARRFTGHPGTTRVGHCAARVPLEASCGTQGDADPVQFALWPGQAVAADSGAMRDTGQWPGPEPHELYDDDGMETDNGPWPPPEQQPDTFADYVRLQHATDAEQTALEEAMEHDPGSPVCPHCGLEGELRQTVSRGWVLLEPTVLTETLPAHTVPPRQRWYVQADGLAWNSGSYEPATGSACRINHKLVCPGLDAGERPTLWGWLDSLRGLNTERARWKADQRTLPRVDTSDGLA